MKILSVIKTSEGANWAFEQSKRLKEKGIDVVTVLPDLNGKVAQKYLKNNMPVKVLDCSLPTKNPFKIFSRKKEIQKLVKEENPDIIHTHFVTNILMLRMALKKDNHPRIFQVPGPLHLENKFFKMLDKKTANSNDYWVATCKKTYKIYESFAPKGHIFLDYYGGYGGNSVNEYQENSNILRKEYNIPKSDILVGMVSYFYKPKKYLGQKRGLKGHEDFIDAMSIIQKENPKVKGIIIGGAWGNSQKYEEEVKKYAKEKCSNNIIFTGFRSDLKKIYKELNIAVHPSHSENLGGAAESLAAGVPTIATNIGGFPDIVVDGKTGYLCEAKNPESIAENINKMLENYDKAKEMAKEGQKLVQNLLDIENTTNKMLEIYKSVEKIKEK